MNVRILYRSATVWNIILFTLLAFFFLYFQEGLVSARSVFEKQFLTGFAIKHVPVIALIGVTSLSIFSLKKIAKACFILTAVVVTVLTARNLMIDFSKLIIIALFLYTLITYYFYQFLSIEVAESYYNPLYNEDDLFPPMLTRLECQLLDKEGNSARGWLTNWNENGCFVYLGEQKTELDSKNLSIKTVLSDRSFESRAALASRTKDGRGIGLKLENKPHDEFGWRDYHSVVDQMGYNVEYLK